MSDWKPAGVVIAVNLVTVIAAVVTLNSLRIEAVTASANQRERMDHKLDAAWQQRIELTARVVKACTK